MIVERNKKSDLTHHQSIVSVLLDTYVEVVTIYINSRLKLKHVNYGCLLTREASVVTLNIQKKLIDKEVDNNRVDPWE